MSNKIITLGATALTALTLAGIAQSTTSFADNTQSQEVLQTEGVQIPDMNLKKALNLALHQDENSAISPEQLTQIKSLDISYQGISSLEGLQYCTNLENLNISNFETKTSKETANTISDLSPLKSLQHLKAIDFRFLPVTDVSPLRDSPIDWFVYGWTSVFSSTVEIVTNEDDSMTLKNPCVGFNGEVLKPKDLKGGVYNETDNTITWSKEELKENIMTYGDHRGYLLLEFEAKGKQENQMASMNVYVKPKAKPENPVEPTTKVKNSFDFYGIGTWSGHDTHFAQLNYNEDQTLTLKEGVEMYGVRVHPYFKNTYASILAKDKDGNVLFNKAFKGIDTVQSKEETFSLPEGATLELYHAEGTSHRFSTNDNQSLKQSPGSTYHYMVQNGKLMQVIPKVKNSFDFYGIGTWSGHDTHFAQLNYNEDQTLTLKEGVEMYGVRVHPYFKNTYASILAKDKDGNVLFNKAFKGIDTVQSKEETFSLPEGATLELYHAEGTSHRFSTNDNQSLKQSSGSTYTYNMQNNQLVLQSVDGKKVDDNQSKNLFLNSNFKVEQKGTHYGIPNWTVATIDAGIDGLSSLKDTYLEKRPINNAGTYLMDSNFYKFEDNSALYSVGSYPCDFIGVNDATHGVTITTSANNARSTCFSQAVDTKPGQKYHFSVDITPNKVTKTKLGGSSVSSEFLERNFMITCENEDGSHLANINAYMMKKKGNTYSVDIPAKSNKIKFYIFLGSAQGVGGFYSAQINNLSLIEK